jgi:hypothetical protein
MMRLRQINELEDSHYKNLEIQHVQKHQDRLPREILDLEQIDAITEKEKI